MKITVLPDIYPVILLICIATHFVEAGTMDSCRNPGMSICFLGVKSSSLTHSIARCFYCNFT